MIGDSSRGDVKIVVLIGLVVFQTCGFDESPLLRQ